MLLAERLTCCIGPHCSIFNLLTRALVHAQLTFFTLPPILQPAQQEAVVVPATSESSVQKMDYVEDGDVPLQGVNLRFDGALLRPLNISLFLQGRLPVALVAEAAVASEVLRVAA
ncbi:unnamed protein product [Calypogeia fissa]